MDLQAAFYNPAISAWSSQPSVAVSRYDGPLDFVVHRAAGTIVLGGRNAVTVGLQVQSFGEFTLADESGVTGSYRPQNTIVELAAGRRIGTTLVLGVRGKWIDSQVAPGFGARGIAGDAGVVWRVTGLPLRVGAALTDFGPALEYGGSAGQARLPTRIRMGVSADASLPARTTVHLAMDVQASPREWNTFSQFAGVAIEYDGVLSARAGFIRETLLEASTGATFGLGIHIAAFTIDLAREMGVNRLGDESHFSLGFRQ
jgi:hypothetical protein